MHKFESNLHMFFLKPLIFFFFEIRFHFTESLDNRFFEPVVAWETASRECYNRHFCKIKKKLKI